MSQTKENADDAQLSDSSDNLCIVCCKNVEIYSIGECDHPVCYECWTRMKVLCGTSECPICRQNIAKVIFTREIRPYRELQANNRSEHYNKKHKICFADLQIQKAFYDLLDHPCPKCESTLFHNFNALRDHIRKEHELFYCDLCVENVKLFTFERKCYNRYNLAMHKRKGDEDNKSFRGHPNCEYCDVRYLDNDELYRHLRREHYPCHFCDADGFNDFYGDYESLYKHFREKHYLCEEEECATNEQFTSVFRTEIDLKAHVANAHSKTLGKQQAKQARTLQLEITLGPRNRSGQRESTVRTQRDEEDSEIEFPIPLMKSQSQPKVIDAKNDQEFPSLVRPSTSSALSTAVRKPSVSMRTRAFGPANMMYIDDFPALGPTNNTSSGVAAKSSYNTELTKQSSTNNQPVSAIVKQAQQPKKNSGGSSMVIHVSNRPNTNNINSSNCTNINIKKFPKKSDFPALPGTSKARISQEEDDFVPDNNTYLGAVPAKYRSLVSGHTSSGCPLSSKITLVQKEDVKPTKAVVSNSKVPSLTVSDFPALKGSQSLLTENVGPKPQKPQNQNNVKSKPVNNLNLISNHSQKKTYTEKKNQKQSKIMTVPTDYDNNNNNNNGGEKKEKKSKKKTQETKKPENVGSKTTKDTKKSGSSDENKLMMKNIKSSDNSSSDNTETKPEAEIKSHQQLNKKNFVPPGFVSTSAKPPPGFKEVTLNSVAKSPNDLTFTTSLGETFSIVPSHQYVYISPPNLFQRNQELFLQFQRIFEHEEIFQEFKYISQKFREGQYNTLPYYEHCQAALGDKFDEIFPELLVLLPDISKQQELYLVHCQCTKQSTSSKNSQKKTQSNLEVCPTCKQVLKSSDKQAHMKAHKLDNNFPALNGNSENHSLKLKK